MLLHLLESVDTDDGFYGSDISALYIAAEKTTGSDGEHVGNKGDEDDVVVAQKPVFSKKKKRIRQMSELNCNTSTKPFRCRCLGIHSSVSS